MTIFEVIPNFMNSITSLVKKPIVIIGDDVSFPKMNLEFHTLHHRWYLYFVNNNLVFVNYPDSYPLHIKHVFSLNKIFLLPECIKGGFAFHFDAEKWVANGGVGARHQSERRPDFKGGATTLAHKWKNTMVQRPSTDRNYEKLFEDMSKVAQKSKEFIKVIDFGHI